MILPRLGVAAAALSLGAPAAAGDALRGFTIATPINPDKDWFDRNGALLVSPVKAPEPTAAPAGTRDAGWTSLNDDVSLGPQSASFQMRRPFTGILSEFLLEPPEGWRCLPALAPDRPDRLVLGPAGLLTPLAGVAAPR